jgi:hypothetical protein
MRVRCGLKRRQRAPLTMIRSQYSRTFGSDRDTDASGAGYRHFGMNTKGLPFTEPDTAFLWASLLMLLSSFAAYLIMRRIGILR